MAVLRLQQIAQARVADIAEQQWSNIAHGAGRWRPKTRIEHSLAYPSNFTASVRRGCFLFSGDKLQPNSTVSALLDVNQCENTHRWPLRQCTPENWFIHFLKHPEQPWLIVHRDLRQLPAVRIVQKWIVAAFAVL